MLAAALLALSVTATAAPDRLLSQPGPVITLAPELDVRRLADGLWLHVAYLDARHGMATNGLLVETPAGPVLLDTGWNETQGARLLDWAERSFRRPVVAVIVTHAHQDRIGGAGAAIARGIPVHALRETQALARAGGQPVPDAALTSPGALRFGGESLEVFFPGPGHTSDNAVVWLPRWRVLYAGCFLKSAGAIDLGNVADADLAAWPASVRRLRERYPTPKLVVPGHGELGGDRAHAGTAEAAAGVTPGITADLIRLTLRDDRSPDAAHPQVRTNAPAKRRAGAGTSGQHCGLFLAREAAAAS